MKTLKQIFLFFILSIFISCATIQKTTVNVEYPVFPNSKAGRELRKFLGTVKIVAIKIEKSKKLGFEPSVNHFLSQIPNIVFTEFSKESYYDLIDTTKRAELTDEVSFSLTGMTQNRLALGKQLGAEAFLYVAFGVMRGLITLDATLIKVETGEIRKSTITERFYSLSGFEKSLKEASKKLALDLSPRVKTIEIKTFTKYSKDKDVQELLLEAQEEIKGDTPNYEYAFKLWKQADKKTKGKSWQVLANIGTYYYAQGDFEKAVEYYQKSMRIRGIKTSDKNYIRTLRKKAESSME